MRMSNCHSRMWLSARKYLDLLLKILKEKWIAIELYVIYEKMLNLKVTKGKNEFPILLEFLNKKSPKSFQVNKSCKKKSVSKSRGSRRALPL